VSQRLISSSRTNQHLFGFDDIFAKIKADHAEIWDFSHIHNLVVATHQGELDATLLDPQYQKQLDNPDAYGRTPLYWACLRGDASKVTSLLAAGAKQTIRNREGKTPLHAATEGGNTTCVELLLRTGPDIHARDETGYTPLHTAAYANDEVGIFELLYAAGASINTQDKWGTSVLASAACLDHPRVANWLLERGADINNPDVVGCTPLYEAVRYCSDSVAAALLDHGAALDRRVANGRTVLHALAASGTLRCMELFLSHQLSGLDADCRDKNGATAWDTFEARTSKPEGMHEVFQRLLDHVRLQQREPDHSDGEGESDFFDAVESH
jgi:ankyrin repeat protein